MKNPITRGIPMSFYNFRLYFSKMSYIHVHVGCNMALYMCLQLCWAKLLMITRFVYIDIDECQEDPSPCDQVCTNTVGGFECSCELGYRYAGEDQGCVGQ